MKFRHLFLSLLFSLTVSTAPAMDIPAKYKKGGFAIGCQAWSFKNFTVFEAIQKTAEAGGKVIEFYPGQLFDRNQPDLRWNHDASEEMIAQIEKELEKFGIKAANYGVVNIPANESEARKIFEFAKRLKIPGITTESENSIDTIEKLVREYDIRVGFHNHPRRPDNPAYKMWDPNHIKQIVEGRDPRIGACADTGHWLRSGLDPVESLKLLSGRIISLHIKDRIDPEKGHDVPLGTGNGKIGEILTELNKQGFSGNISVEFEHNWNHSVPEIAESIGFVNGFGTARGWK